MTFTTTHHPLPQPADQSARRNPPRANPSVGRRRRHHRTTPSPLHEVPMPISSEPTANPSAGSFRAGDTHGRTSIALHGSWRSTACCRWATSTSSRRRQLTTLLPSSRPPLPAPSSPIFLPRHPGPHHRPLASTHAHHRHAKPNPLFLHLPIGPTPAPSCSRANPSTQASAAPEPATPPSPSFTPKSASDGSDLCPRHRAAAPDSGRKPSFLLVSLPAWPTLSLHRTPLSTSHVRRLGRAAPTLCRLPRATPSHARAIERPPPTGDRPCRTSSSPSFVTIGKVQLTVGLITHVWYARATGEELPSSSHCLHRLLLACVPPPGPCRPRSARAVLYAVPPLAMPPPSFCAVSISEP